MLRRSAGRARPGRIDRWSGAPLVTPDGQTIGELCVKDVHPRSPSAAQLEALTTLAHSVMAQLELERWQSREPEDGETRSIPASTSPYDLPVERMTDGAIGVGLDNRILHANAAACRLLGYSEQELLGHDGHALLHHTFENGTPYPVADCQIGEAARTGHAGWRNGEILWRRDGSCLPIEYCVVRAPGTGPEDWLLLFHEAGEERIAQRETEPGSAP